MDPVLESPTQESASRKTDNWHRRRLSSPLIGQSMMCHSGDISEEIHQFTRRCIALGHVHECSKHPGVYMRKESVYMPRGRCPKCAEKVVYEAGFPRQMPRFFKPSINRPRPIIPQDMAEYERNKGQGTFADQKPRVLKTAKPMDLLMDLRLPLDRPCHNTPPDMAKYQHIKGTKVNEKIAAFPMQIQKHRLQSRNLPRQVVAERTVRYEQKQGADGIDRVTAWLNDLGNGPTDPTVEGDGGARGRELLAMLRKSGKPQQEEQS